MADLSYSEQQPVDNGGAKFLGVVVNNSGANEMAAISGESRRTQNGEIIADLNINSRNQITGGMSWLANYTLNTAAAEQSLTVDSTLGGVQFSAFHSATTHVLITAAGGEMRFTLRGSAPTNVTGHRIFPHDAWIMEKAMAAAAKFIRGYSAPADGVLYLTELIERAIKTIT